MRVRKFIAWRVVALLACGSFVACGGIAVLPTPEEVCIGGGGEWRTDGCLGGEDVCGAVVCETALGEGCGCAREDECWDGTACVAIEPTEMMDESGS